MTISGHFTPLDFDGAKWSDDGGAFQPLVPVEDDGRDALHFDAVFFRDRAGGVLFSKQGMVFDLPRASLLAGNEGLSARN